MKRPTAHSSWAGTIEIALVYLRVRWLLLRRGLRGALSRLRADRRAATSTAVPSKAAGESPRDLASAVERTLRRAPVDSKYIVKSLVLIGLLVRRGRAPTLVVALDRGPEFTSRMWVDCDGESLNVGDSSSRYRMFEL